MNDRFKFRVWKKAENKMVYDVTYLNPLLLDEDIAKEKAKNYVVMQSTGLLDKNGKLIYEGDVVKLDDELNCIVQLHSKYDMDYGRIEFILIGGHPKCPTIYIPTVANESEVIGNIY